MASGMGSHVIRDIFFFFQAEDGIRDADVTGVQTCALPICQAHNSLAWVKYSYEWNFPEAEKEFRRSLELNPGASWSLLWYGMYLAQGNRIAESTAEMKDRKSTRLNSSHVRISYAVLCL